MQPGSVRTVTFLQGAPSDLCRSVKFLPQCKTYPPPVHIHPEGGKVIQKRCRPVWHIVRRMHVLQSKTMCIISVSSEKRVVLDGKRNSALLGVRQSKDCGGTKDSCKSNGLHWVAI